LDGVAGRDGRVLGFDGFDVLGLDGRRLLPLLPEEGRLDGLELGLEVLGRDCGR
jgi:hypothetical protein